MNWLSNNAFGKRLLGLAAALAVAALVVAARLDAAPAPPAPRPPAAPPPARPAAPAADTSQIDISGGCLTAECHANLGEPRFKHGPVNMGQCAPCHVPVGNRHVFQEMPQVEGTVCLLCHQPEAAQPVVHQPFRGQCQLCHDPHGGDNRYFVMGGLGAEGCARCHSDIRQGLDFVHGPVALGECLACHTPHQSAHKGLLSESRGELCRSCHVDVAASLEGAVSIHEPVRDDCGGCHSPHGGANEFFLAAQGRQLCGECHAGFLTQIDNFKYPHKVMDADRGCESCHRPHSSNQAALLTTNNQDLCLECHGQTVRQADRTLSNVGAQIREARFLHGPLREDNCIACHKAHGSDHPNILELAFPAEFYAPYREGAYDLCFNCHDRQLVLEERSSATGFRNGSLNLHYLHVNREKGRSCRACHHEHASSQPNHVRTEVPFGRWPMPVQFSKTESGGTCSTGCHLPYRYDRVNEVQNRTERPS